MKKHYEPYLHNAMCICVLWRETVWHMVRFNCHYRELKLKNTTNGLDKSRILVSISTTDKPPVAIVPLKKYPIGQIENTPLIAGWIPNATANEIWPIRWSKLLRTGVKSRYEVVTPLTITIVNNNSINVMYVSKRVRLLPRRGSNRITYCQAYQRR